jgi:hypothetical protein
MPEISRFFGIVITMYYNDHGVPHFHARYGDYRAKVLVESGAVIDGHLPRRGQALVEEWRLLHVDELLSVWQQLMDRQPHDKIEPLE